MSESYYTTHEVSKFCNVYPTTVINWINEGILSAFTTPGGHRRVKKDDLVQLMRQNHMPIPDELMENGKTKVLVVDDDLRILKMVKTILEAEGDFEVATAKDGFEAGIMVYDFMPDVILLDFVMPQIDGFEVCKRLKRDEKTKNIPIIAVTVLRDEKEINKMRAVGVTDHIAKPFKTSELVESIRKHAMVPEKLHVG